MLHFFASLSWWEWLIGIPSFIVVAYVMVAITLGILINVVFLALTNQRFGRFAFMTILLGSVCAVAGIIARHT